MDIPYLKREIIETLEGVDIEQMDLHTLKEYSEIVKVVSEIKDREPIEMMGEVMPVSYNMYEGRNMRTIKQLKEGKRDSEEREDD